MPTSQLFTDFIVQLTDSTGTFVWRWYHSATPLEWTVARDRIIALSTDLSTAGLGRRGARGGWMLSVDPKDVDVSRRSSRPSLPL
jgi:hypothetical protein